MPYAHTRKLALLAFLLPLFCLFELHSASALDVLVFSKTAGFRHKEGIPAGNAFFKRLSQTAGWKTSFTEDSSEFNDEKLAATDVVVWNNVSGNVLNAEQRQAFKKYLERGGGFVGIHNAMHAEMNWPFYSRMLGTQFLGHGRKKDQFQDVEIVVENSRHPICRHFPTTFIRKDEWYNFKANPRPHVGVLMHLNEATLSGPNMGGDHPVTWINESHGLRVFYTAFGHTAETFAEPSVQTMLYQAVLWGAGQDPQIIVDEFNGTTEPGSWVLQAPYEGTFPYKVQKDQLIMTGMKQPSANQQLTREGASVDATRAYAIEATFRITTTGGIQSFAMNFLQDDQPTDDPINTWSLNLDLRGDGTDGVIKKMGFVQGRYKAIAPHRPAKWARANTDYIYRIDVNRRLDGSFAPKWVTAQITTLDGTLQDRFEVDYSHFPWQPDLSKPVQIGLNSHFATWTARDLKVFYTDIPKEAESMTKRLSLRAGIIGCDTSHVPAFTQIFNNAKPDDPIFGIRVVAAFPGGSDDIAVSRDRVKKFSDQLREMDVEIVDSIEELLKRVDVVLLESVDGRKHLEQVRPIFEAGKTVFIDKPLGGTLADAVEIVELAKKHKVPFFSSSAHRYTPGIAAARNNAAIGDIRGCAAYSPCVLEPTHPDLFWYGVHGVEALFTIMGPDCKQVSRTHTDGAELVSGVWNDGRIGTFRGIRSGKKDFGALVFGSKSNQDIRGFGGYKPLVVQIAQFFKTKQPPVNADETLAMFAFMEAADESKRQGGKPVTLESVLSKARAEVQARQ